VVGGVSVRLLDGDGGRSWEMSVGDKSKVEGRGDHEKRCSIMVSSIEGGDGA
jgi:hypothetical protein